MTLEESVKAIEKVNGFTEPDTIVYEALDCVTRTITEQDERIKVLEALISIASADIVSDYGVTLSKEELIVFQEKRIEWLDTIAKNTAEANRTLRERLAERCMRANRHPSFAHTQYSKLPRSW